MMAYLMPTNGKAERDVVCDYIYGSLPADTYRASKDVTDLRANGDHGTHAYYVEFTIA